MVYTGEKDSSMMVLFLTYQKLTGCGYVAIHIAWQWAKNFIWYRLYDLLEVNDRKYKQAFWLNITSTLISRLYFAHETLFFIYARTIKKEAKKIVANTSIAVWQLICYMTPEFKLPKRKTYLRNGIPEQNHLGKQLFLHFLWDRNHWRSGKTGV